MRRFRNLYESIKGTYGNLYGGVSNYILRFIRDLPSKARTGVGLAVLGPTALYLLQKIPELAPTFYSSLDERLYWVVPTFLFGIVAAVADVAGSVITAYLPPTVYTLGKMFESARRVFLRGDKKPVDYSEVSKKFQEATASLRRNWGDIVGGWFDDGLGAALLTAFYCLRTGDNDLTQIQNLSLLAKLIVFFGTGTVADIIGDTFMATLKYGGHLMYRVGESLQYFSKPSNLTRREQRLSKGPTAPQPQSQASRPLDDMEAMARMARERAKISQQPQQKSLKPRVDIQALMELVKRGEIPPDDLRASFPNLRDLGLSPDELERLQGYLEQQSNPTGLLT